MKSDDDGQTEFVARAAAKTIGNLNSGWAFLLKLLLGVTPILILGQVWMARTIWTVEIKLEYMQAKIMEMHLTVNDLQIRMYTLEKNRP